MINSVKLENFGPLSKIEWKNLSRINLVIGDNDCGKTFLLKAIYSTVRTLEEYKRGDDPRAIAEILADKLYWVFQPDKIGDLVTKKADTPLSCAIEFDGREFHYSFGKDTSKQITAIENHVEPLESNSIFLPAKEVLSIHHIILESRERDKVFGFDDTYLDLARALRQSPKGGENYQEFEQSRKNFKTILNGTVEFDESSGRWLFKKGKQNFPIGVTAEGIKKIAILDTLLGNRYLSPQSTIVIDEPESALHPTAISRLLEIVAVLADCGIQFFLASHSYFVVKKLFLIAQEKNISIPVLSERNNHWTNADLRDGMPDNPIINESIELYRTELELSLT